MSHPRSRREGSVADANEMLNIKLESMGMLRGKFRDLTELQKNEEEGLKETMGELVRHAADEEEKVERLEDQLAAYKRLLHEEEKEKQQAVDMVSQFKREGELIMEKLKTALKDMTQKYEAEKARRTKVEAGVAGKLDSYRQLLEQQERVTVQFKEKNAQLEIKLHNAEKLVKDITRQDNLNQDYKGIISELKGVDKSRVLSPKPTQQEADPERSVEHKLRLQEQIIQMLYAKLKSEQTHRLETEEQAASMVAAEEDTIRKLEDKLREVEADKERGTPRAAATPRHHGFGTPRAMHSTPLLSRGLESPSPPRNAFAQKLVASSLESQLAEVTKDFNQSLEMWSKRLNTPPAGGGGVDAGLFNSNGMVDTPTDDHLEPTSIPFAPEETDYLPDSPLPPAPNLFRTSDLLDDDFLPDSPNPILASDL
eukprot:TRINITY_DN21298_c0_g1_i1.p1 TRINITY_DN21298_c0_g1~~TRINITY_DN21298_c0_g1_i1.p1  ORF type:complete len:425 (+),score=133.46 TRINITY_DN21298_c0_g1_i1:45-1319(+)